LIDTRFFYFVIEQTLFSLPSGKRKLRTSLLLLGMRQQQKLRRLGRKSILWLTELTQYTHTHKNTYTYVK